MTKLTKAQKAAHERVEPGKAYPAEAALKLVKELATAKFTESVVVAINLGIYPKKSDQVVRGSTVLPNGSG
jgi:large subunit ribosomal protein L1